MLPSGQTPVSEALRAGRRAAPSTSSSGRHATASARRTAAWGASATAKAHSTRSRCAKSTTLAARPARLRSPAAAARLRVRAPVVERATCARLAALALAGDEAQELRAAPPRVSSRAAPRGRSPRCSGPMRTRTSRRTGCPSFEQRAPDLPLAALAQHQHQPARVLRRVVAGDAHAARVRPPVLELDAGRELRAPSRARRRPTRPRGTRARSRARDAAAPAPRAPSFVSSSSPSELRSSRPTGTRRVRRAAAGSSSSTLRRPASAAHGSAVVVSTFCGLCSSQ